MADRLTRCELQSTDDREVHSCLTESSLSTRALSKRVNNTPTPLLNRSFGFYFVFLLTLISPNELFYYFTISTITQIFFYLNYNL